MDDDLTTPAGRLRWARKKAGFVSAKSAAIALKMNPVSYRALENDQHGYATHAVLFAKKFGVTAEWLMEGEGDPAQKVSSSAVEATSSGQYEIELIKEVDIAYAMGDGSFISDYPETSYIPFTLNFLRQFTRGSTEALFIATGHGDSMEPTLRREDRLMIDTSQRTIKLQDQIWALAYAETGMVKRVRRLSGGKLELLSDNPSVPPQIVDEADVHVVGKVVWVARVM